MNIARCFEWLNVVYTFVQTRLVKLCLQPKLTKFSRVVYIFCNSKLCMYKSFCLCFKNIKHYISAKRFMKTSVHYLLLFVFLSYQMFSHYVWFTLYSNKDSNLYSHLSSIFIPTFKYFSFFKTIFQLKSFNCSSICQY